MSIDDMRLYELIKDDGTALTAANRFTFASTHKERLAALRTVLDHCCNELEKYRQLKQKHSEDELTIEIVSQLNTLGFQADHDPKHGGHCDIVVKAPAMFIWIAEAKIHSNYGWLDKGFKQLTTRYSSGVPGQDVGEVLIYCKAPKALEKLNKWREELELRNEDVTTEDCGSGSPLVFWSTHEHVNSGLPFRTRHKIVCLHHNPKD